MDTVNTMGQISKSNIHIASVGYEVDRIVEPASKEDAKKVYLLIHNNKSEDKSLRFLDQITKALKNKKIEVVHELHDRNDLFKIIKSVKTILDKEHNNIIYVNLAAGSKLQAVGMMMACMMYNDDKNVHPFYVEAKEYPGFDGKEAISTGIKDIKTVPQYAIQIPSQKLIKALEIIKKHDGNITKKELANIADMEKVIVINAEEKNYSQARYASLDKNIIAPLEKKWKFIHVEKRGSSRYIRLTEDGRNASEFLI